MFKDNLTPGRITIIYAILAIVWILFSDWAVTALVPASDIWARLQTFKGVVYVFVTSLLLYWLMSRSVSTIQRSRQALERTAQRLENLHALDRSILESHSPDEMAQNALHRLRTLVPADRCSVVLFDHENGEAEVLHVDVNEPGTGPPTGARFALEHASVLNISKKESVQESIEYIRDVTTHSSSSPVLQQFERAGIHSIASVVLRTGNHVLGALNLAAKKPAAFTREHRETAQEIADQLAIGIRQIRLYEESERRAARLETLYTIHRAAAESLDIEETLAAILDTVLEELAIDMAGVYMLNDDHTRLTLHGYRGTSDDLARAVSSLRIDTAVSGEALKNRAPTVTRVDEYPDPEIQALLVQQGVETVASVPLLSGGTPIGTLTMATRDRRTFQTRDLRLLSALGQHLGQSIQNGQLHSDLESSYIQTVLALSSAMDARDTYTADHSKKLAQWAVATAEQLECSVETINSIRWGALLHDIGKIGVPDRILQKSGPLTDEEWEIMQRHPDIGADIVAPVKRMADVAPLIRAHQEKYDGTGYPHGLTGEEIPLGARILAVVDAYSAITDKRPYKDAQSHDYAVAELKRCAGSHFDPNVVEAFLEVLAGQTEE